MNLKLIKRNRVYEGRVFTTIVDDVEYPSGVKTIREIAEHPGGAVVLAVFEDRRIILIHQHRYPLGKFIWELPAGKLDAGEDPMMCALRELEEETGYSANKLELLTSIYTTPGFCTETLHIYLAIGLSEVPGGRRLEEGEETMSMKIVPMQEALAMIERREILDSKSICGILLGDRMLEKIIM
jgi:ADP-ribose pyrophosphatase